MKPQPHSTSSTDSPAPSTRAASCPPPHSVWRWKAKGPTQRHPSTAPMMKPLTPQQEGTNSPGKRSLASGEHPGLVSPTHRHHTNTPRHRHCSDSPGRQQPAEQYTAKPAQPSSQQQQPLPDG
ncbi:hypothetical protein ILYODFUR_002961 [Ilyodon furcidens]|uniref:Uncharacterized protein n=1 Tax=Ilyodon furcidens TaxID=33524 RepID=A0ABV0U297_9TELE